ncbi:transcriptional repressor MprA [Oligella urethralis]|uniref:MarR family winged helix-turn-helix transcriptional regulator n=1 Tax=Oligella urethralis TaxID=90245 RepID=UPI00035C1745|nr:MarR family transcriptional regulator [Oligella urethralis]SUA55015.1 transcriptional repressor MprA [Oligella urethralis]SUA64735.1 transcriptional repressor MprA [Oligella urethralis]SUA94374.1 transcriptional repressor MprA [Oligella urethralis]
MNIDLETRINDSSSDDLRLVLRLAAFNSLIQNELRNRLRLHFNMTTPRYDLLAQLASEPQGLKMGELSERLMVSNGNITAISLQLEKAGLISRNTNRQDRRSTFIKMTTKGKKAFAKMETAYNQWLSELLAQLPESAKTRLYQSLAEGKEAVTKAVEESKVDA